MLNGLQILVHMPLFRTHFPSNSLLMIQYIIKVATFDIVPEDWIVASIDLPVTDKSALSLEFKECGYEYIYPIYNLGSTYFLMQIYAGMLFVYLLLVMFSKRLKWAETKR